MKKSFSYFLLAFGCLGLQLQADEGRWEREQEEDTYENRQWENEQDETNWQNRQWENEQQQRQQAEQRTQPPSPQQESEDEELWLELYEKEWGGA